MNQRAPESWVERPGRDIRWVRRLGVKYSVHERRVHIVATCADTVQSQPPDEEVLPVECLRIFNPAFDVSVVV